MTVKGGLFTKAISNGNIFDIYDDTLQTYEQLPAQIYSLRCSQKRGFFLEKHADIDIREEKIYGVHEEKIAKVVKAFGISARSLGAILSGPKGIGKSLFAKLLARTVVSQGMPVILVDTYIPGVASYIESIEQEVMVLFDEFDKTFSNIKARDGEASPETELLTLFDGMSGGKKLYVVTCNDLYKLNEYLVNRPGRFHFHFRFENPTDQEIEEYLRDKLNPEYYDQIPHVVAFSNKIELNYDCLRAIAFELNMGYPFKEAIVDLNILNINTERYKIVIRLSNGYTMTCDDVALDLFSGEEIGRSFDNKDCNNVAWVTIDPTNAVYDPQAGGITVDPESIRFDFEESNLKKEQIEELKKAHVEYCIINMRKSRPMHYKLV